MVTYLGENPDTPFVMKTKKGNHSYKAKQVQAFVGKSIHAMLVAAYSPIVGTSRAIQAFTGSTDLEKITTNVWNAFQETPNFDMLWQEAFRAVPLRKGQLEWTIGSVTSGVILQLLEEGEKVRYARIEGTTVKAGVELYGSGLEISWKTMEGRDLAGFYNAMIDFRAKRMSEYADVHYGLLAAAALSNQVAWQGAAEDTTIDRDIQTMNEGNVTIGENTKDSGYGDTANARMLLYVSPKLRNRLNAALRATSADVIRGANQGQTVDANIEIRYTYNSSIPVNKGIMVLPGNKVQNSVYMDEKSFERQNADNLSFLKSSFTAFGAIVGDTDQTAELSFA